MTRKQRAESRYIKGLMKYWWMAQNEPYKRLRRHMRKLRRETNPTTYKDYEYYA